jgi:CheY-like chemotaxis protein
MPLIKERADLGEVLHEVADMVHGLAHARGLRLELDLPDDLPALRLDRTRVRQVLLNLLTNATRFTDTGWIRMRVRAEEREVVVTVEDSGCGIPSDRLARAFEAFSQLHEDHIPEGSGLGLAVSKKFIELHGGRMWIESEVGRGTTVGFTLPIPQEEKETPASPLRTGVSLRSHDERPLVLVLHEDARILGLLRRHVDGYQFLMADAVDKARDIVQEALPVAVIADTAWADRWSAFIPDLNLPPHVPLVTCPLPSLRRVGLLLGATDYLPKPVARADLENALSRLPRLPQTVLVVDDDPHVVRLLARMLKAINPSLRVWEAFGGKEGLEIARSQRPDVMLLDLFMPELSGFDLLEEMAHDEAMAKMQIIIVSVRSVEQEATPIMGELRLAREAGFSLTEILQVLQATLSTVTQPVAGFPASAAARLAAQTG